MSQVKTMVSATNGDPRGASANAPKASAAGQPEATSAGVKALYWLLRIIVLGYAVSLVVRANGASADWLDGWGTAAYSSWPAPWS